MLDHADSIDEKLTETRLDKDARSSNPICCLCGNPIQNNRGIYWVKGTGGIYARGIYPSKVYCVHEALSCSRPVGQYFAQFKPDERGEFWFYGRLPFQISTDEEPTDNDRFVYVIKSGDNYKIGIAKEPRKRMRDLQTGDPTEHALVTTSFVSNAQQLEAKIHQHYSQYSVRGEWFKLPFDKLEEVLEILWEKGFVLKVPPFENVVYYQPGTRVLWNGSPGTVSSLDVKPYKYEVGYNILLDKQGPNEYVEITNAAYSELCLEETGEKSTEGYEVDLDPSIPSTSVRTVYDLKDLLEMEDT